MADDPTPAGFVETICRHCGYDLHGLSDLVCPECGQIYEPPPARVKRKLWWWIEPAGGALSLVMSLYLVRWCLTVPRVYLGERYGYYDTGGLTLDSQMNALMPVALVVAIVAWLPARRDRGPGRVVGCALLLACGMWALTRIAYALVFRP
jgi:hypothetical protein